MTTVVSFEFFLVFVEVFRLVQGKITLRVVVADLHSSGRELLLPWIDRMERHLVLYARGQPEGRLRRDSEVLRLVGWITESHPGLLSVFFISPL